MKHCWQGRRRRLGALGLVMLVVLTGCGNRDEEAGETDDPLASQSSVDAPSGTAENGAAAAIGANATGQIDPAYYAGDVAFLVEDDISLRGVSVPVKLLVGLSDRAETRLGVNAFADLRGLQALVPGLLSGVLDETCGHRYAVAVESALAEGEQVRIEGQLQAEFFTCRRRGTEEERRGFLLYSQNVDVVARASAAARGTCINAMLTDVELDPRGLVGGIADLFGLTKRARNVILEKGGAYLAENPLCPTLPPGLALVAPVLDSGGPREIPVGGAGVAVTGSVDTSATTLIALLDLMQERGLLEPGQ